MSPESMRQRFYRVAAELVESDPRVCVVLAEIGVGYLADVGVFDRHPERVINVGIREGLMVGAAAGMALEGMRPIAHSYAPFLIERTFEQVKLDFAHQGVGGILVSVGASYDWAEGGRTHHSPGDVAMMGTVPGWSVHVPGHPDEVESVLRAAVARDDSVYIRLSDAVNHKPHLDGIGAFTVVREGRSGGPTIVAVGPMLQPVLDALTANDANAPAIGGAIGGATDSDATVLYTATARPMDAGGLRASVTGSDVVLVEPYLEGTSAGEVTAALSGRPIRLRSIGVPNVELRRFGTRHDHDRAYGLDAAGLSARLVDQLVGTEAGSG